jgi:hypothetical protein
MRYIASPVKTKCVKRSATPHQALPASIPQVAERAFNGAAKRMRLWFSSTFAHVRTRLIFGKTRDEPVDVARTKSLLVAALLLLMRFFRPGFPRAAVP